MGVTFQSESEILSFVKTGYWRGSLYQDQPGVTYQAAGVSGKGVSCWKKLQFARKVIRGQAAASKPFLKAQKGSSGNLKGVGQHGTAMLLVRPSAAGADRLLWSQQFAEDPAVVEIFAALGASVDELEVVAAKTKALMQALAKGEQQQQQQQAADDVESSPPHVDPMNIRIESGP